MSIPARQDTFFHVLILLLVSSSSMPAAAARAACEDPSQVFATPVSYSLGNSFGVTSGDFNEDGIADIAAVGVYSAVAVRLGTGSGGVGDGGFTTSVGYAVGTSPWWVTAGDFNEDGILDLATANVGTQNVSVILGQGTAGVGNGTFGTPTHFPAGGIPIYIASSDVNDDGILDLLVSDLGTGRNAVYVMMGLGSLGVGNGTFAPRVAYATGVGPVGFTVADFNEDGIEDLAVANFGTNTVSILRGNGAAGVGNGTFASPVHYTVGAAPIAIAAADLDGDDITDLVVSNFNDGNIMFLRGQGASGVGDGTFLLQGVFTAGTNPRGIAIEDFNSDGIVDVVVANQAGSGTSLLVGQSLGGVWNGSFNRVAYPGAGRATALVAREFSEDGALDVAVVSESENLHIYLGNCPAPPLILTGFNPAGGRVGDAVTIHGVHLSGTNEVRFNGVSADILSVFHNAVSTRVPAGATTGPITVSTAMGSATTSASFFVGERPVVAAATPGSGNVGTPIVLTGDHFTGATRVSFGSLSNAPFTVDSDEQITAEVDLPAVTGPITVTTPAASGTSAFHFVVLPPDRGPTLEAIVDVPRDQGGKVLVTWRKSDVDDPSMRVITGYRVWRRALAAPIANGTPESALAGPEATYRRIERAGNIEYWEALATLPAVFRDAYVYTAPTTQDSMRNSNAYTAFFVQALTADPYVFYDSSVDSGYSVDNLPPGRPNVRVAAYGASGGVQLRWRPNPESDLMEYRLHRGTSTTFELDAANLIAAQSDTGYLDRAGTRAHFYKLGAVDIHGNVSSLVLVTPQGEIVEWARLASGTATPRRVQLVWDAVDGAGLTTTIHRRTEHEPWSVVATRVADAGAHITFEDIDVQSGHYGYRLAVMDGEREVYVGETWIDVPAPGLALLGVSPNPSMASPLMVRVRLLDDRAARLQLIDVAGRVIASREVGSLGPGDHAVSLANGVKLHPGVHVVRLAAAGTSQSKSVVILR